MIPFGVLALADSLDGVASQPRPLLAFVVGWAVVMGPWLVKNVIDTGNPVYPLGYRVFHGRHWDEAMQTKWQAAHGPRADLTARSCAASLVDVAGRSDWQSPLYVALAPLALLRPGSRRLALAPLGLSRPTSSHVVAVDSPARPVLAAAPADPGRPRRPGRRLGPAPGLVDPAGPDPRDRLALRTWPTSRRALAGFNEWTGDLTFLRRDLPERLNPPLATLDAELPPDARVLLVGQAAVFHLDRTRSSTTRCSTRRRSRQLASGKDVGRLPSGTSRSRI